jgi:uncharacterized membrane protein
MRNKEDINELLDYLQNRADKELQFDEEAIAAAYQKNYGNHSLAIKVLSVFGGLLASLAFSGFLLPAGLYNSVFALLIFGTLCIGGAIWINKESGKIFIDTIRVSAFIIGFILLGLGLENLATQTLTSVVFIILHY